MSALMPERRAGFDRRKLARGGRRPGDVDGFAPLVLVADDDVDNSGRCEAILAGLRFAVAPAHSAEEALRVMQALRPNLVVA
ncbi:MAG TPA: response regulator, partial [Vicinamibacterales bacterium]